MSGGECTCKEPVAEAVYVLQSEAGLYKIGMTARGLSRRLPQVRREYGMKFKPLHVITTPRALWLERQIHRELAPFLVGGRARGHRELFDLPGPVLSGLMSVSHICSPANARLVQFLRSIKTREWENSECLAVPVPKQLKRQLRAIMRDLEDMEDPDATITRVAIDILEAGIERYAKAVRKRKEAAGGE